MYSRIIIWIVVLVLIIGGVFYFLKPAPMVQAPITENQLIINNTVPAKSSTTSTQTYNINIANFAFGPNTLNINKGDMVVWTNNDSVPHQIQGDNFQGLDSSVLSKGATYSFTFNDVGTFDYHCVVHPMMKAKIIVK